MAVPLASWHDRLQAVLDAGNGSFRRVIVVRETDSTQDAARRLAAGHGDVVVAWRQTAGRGRMGRAWADTGRQGVAVTFVTPAAPHLDLVKATAAGAAEAARKLLGRPAEIKWPNDVLVDGRKICGVLIEIADGTAFVGVGMNVGQTQWPQELAGRAVSLAQLGAAHDRIEVLEALLASVGQRLAGGPGA